MHDDLKKKLLEHLMDMMGGMDGERVPPKSGLSAMAGENADDQPDDAEPDQDGDDGMDPRLMIIIKAKKAGAARG